jgi:phage N-6-adenine-methyltransferase
MAAVAIETEFSAITDSELSVLADCEEKIEKGLKTFYEVGQALLTIRDKRLYRADYPTFETYCVKRWGIARQHAYRLIDAAGVITNLSPIGDKDSSDVTHGTQKLPQTESQVRPLTQLETPEEQREVWQEVTEKAEEEGRKVTAKDVQTAVDERKNPSQYITQSNDNEWYTPIQYIEAARIVLGQFDLDPASNPLANETVCAHKFFTKEDDGLSKPWIGKLWLNPPYGKECREFVGKLITEYSSGNVEEAILLVNANSTDTAWFQPLWDHLICFTNHRINFYQADGVEKNGSTHGSVFVYLGRNRDLFAKTFSAFGAVVQRFAA